MIRTRAQRQADRDWCQQMAERNAHRDLVTADGIVLACAVGCAFWLAVAFVAGWIA